MKKINLILSGGGVRSYAHLGVYKALMDKGIEIAEIVAISGGSIVAPFMALGKDPNKIIELMKEDKPHKKMVPKWFIPDKFEVLLTQPDTSNVGRWVSSQFLKEEKMRLKEQGKLHIMAVRDAHRLNPIESVDMFQHYGLASSVAASSAINGVFKPHEIDDFKYMDGGHDANLPIFFPFRDQTLPVVAVNLGYAGKAKKTKGRVGQIMHGIEVMQYFKFQNDITLWNRIFGAGRPLIVINPKVYDIRSVDFGINGRQMDSMIQKGYAATQKTIMDEFVKLAERVERSEES